MFADGATTPRRLPFRRYSPDDAAAMTSWCAPLLASPHPDPQQRAVSSSRALPMRQRAGVHAVLGRWPGRASARAQLAIFATFPLLGRRLARSRGDRRTGSGPPFPRCRGLDAGALFVSLLAMRCRNLDGTVCGGVVAGAGRASAVGDAVPGADVAARRPRASCRSATPCRSRATSRGRRVLS